MRQKSGHSLFFPNRSGNAHDGEGFVSDSLIRQRVSVEIFAAKCFGQRRNYFVPIGLSLAISTK
jgi:hypothetical protein